MNEVISIFFEDDVIVIRFYKRRYPSELYYGEVDLFKCFVSACPWGTKVNGSLICLLYKKIKTIILIFVKQLS